MTALAGIALAGLVVYGLLCLVKPMRRCPRCKGRKVVQRRRGVRPCGRCKGTGKARRIGAAYVHRTIHAKTRLK
jgi:DnaJ-class molecular chaperone